MTEKEDNGMKCSQFEALLPDAIDGVLSEEMGRMFHAHVQDCPACGPMFAEAREGMLWLQRLEELPTPANLVHNILAATSAGEPGKASLPAPVVNIGWATRLWSPVRAALAGALQPRFATSFSMAFFSLSLTLTLAGVKIKDLARIDWHPSAMSKAVVMQYTQVESKVVRYYKNMRLVYEIESRVGELRKNSGAYDKKDEQPEQPAPAKEKDKKQNNDTSGRPEQRQEHYSQETGDAAIAYLKTKPEGAYIQ